MCHCDGLGVYTAQTHQRNPHISKLSFQKDAKTDDDQPRPRPPPFPLSVSLELPYSTHYQANLGQENEARIADERE